MEVFCHESRYMRESRNAGNQTSSRIKDRLVQQPSLSYVLFLGLVGSTNTVSCSRCRSDRPMLFYND